MICLTGDLHDMSLGTGNQKHCDTTEMRVALRYLKMLEEANVKVTFFITGRAFAEEWDDVRPIAEHPLVEVGGHTYYCFTPALWHRAWNKLTGNYNGPRWYQKWDIRRTIRIIEQRSGTIINCWRNHMYMHGPHTESCLRACGIKVCSDGVMRHSNGPLPHPTGLLNFPINVMPDHEHLYHAERTPEWVEWWVKRYKWSDDYGPRSYYIDEWTDRVIAEVREHEQNGVLSNILIHPITLYLCDRFKSFERLLDCFSGCQSVHMSEACGIQAPLKAQRGAC